jgi:hypothetical protein
MLTGLDGIGLVGNNKVCGPTGRDWVGRELGMLTGLDGIGLVGNNKVC